MIGAHLIIIYYTVLCYYSKEPIFKKYHKQGVMTLDSIICLETVSVESYILNCT